MKCYISQDYVAWPVWYIKQGMVLLLLKYIEVWLVLKRVPIIFTMTVPQVLMSYWANVLKKIGSPSILWSC